ncbi:lipid II flippase MurJ [Massilia sp. IC2-476]|uniref:lipid II flippase MurJ n=1 Tax=Massilia sp. IC2-476 TaxID=2887199 RepID=UPI001D0FC1D6|nr:lipid II flippase MurJ [Massilia sp. IC2-476]MCC2973782.1 polysaccharide biosynthesis C-terminal domain-containing protein [Massilia sp. IC2-476]
MTSTLGTRIRTADARHAAILRGLVLVALFTLLGKLMGAAKEMAVAYRYGLAAEVDAYQFLYTLVSWPIGIWSSVLTAVLVPLAARMQGAGPAELPRFRAELLGLAIVFGLGLALLAWLLIGAILSLGKAGLPAPAAGLAQAALPGLVLLLPLGLLTTLQSAWMLAAGRHVNTLLDSIPTFFIAAAVLAFPSGSIKPLVWGTVAGCGFHLAALLLPMARRRELEAPSFSLVSPQWTWFWQGFGIMLGGQALMSFTTVIDQFYAAGLGTGAIATLGYANRVLSLILGLAAVAVARATLPVFSQAQPEGPATLWPLALGWARLMFLGGIATMFLSWLLAPWAIGLLFERGQFGPADTRIVSEVLRYGLPQLPFYFSSMVLVSYALSQRRYTLIFWSGVIGCVAKVLGNLFLAPSLGVNGVALAATFTYGLNALFFWLTLRRTP